MDISFTPAPFGLTFFFLLNGGTVMGWKRSRNNVPQFHCYRLPELVGYKEPIKIEFIALLIRASPLGIWDYSKTRGQEVHFEGGVGLTSVGIRVHG